MAKFHVEIWQLWKSACILETAAYREKMRSIFTFRGKRETICATSGTLANGQVSCPNMASLKFAQYLGNRAHRVKMGSISTPWGRKGVSATSGTLANGQVPCPNMAILIIGPYLRNRCPEREYQLDQFQLYGGRKRVYVQLLELRPMAKFHAQMWQFWKSACISEAAARRSKISLIF